MTSKPTPQGPTIHADAYLAAGCQIIGNVTIEADCFIGPNAVLRGDIEPIVVREGANVQDCVVLHTHHGSPVSIGRDVSLGHGAIVHGATIEDHALVGMNAVVLDDAVVGEAAVIGALALVPAGFSVPAGSLAVGAPCRVVKKDDARMRDMAVKNGKRYHQYRADHMAGRWQTVTGAGGPVARDAPRGP